MRTQRSIDKTIQLLEKEDITPSLKHRIRKELQRRSITSTYATLVDRDLQRVNAQKEPKNVTKSRRQIKHAGMLYAGDGIRSIVKRDEYEAEAHRRRLAKQGIFVPNNSTQQESEGRIDNKEYRKKLEEDPGSLFYLDTQGCVDKSS